MARFNRRRYDYRGPEYDERFGRYEGAFARRAARGRGSGGTAGSRRALAHAETRGGAVERP